MIIFQVINPLLTAKRWVQLNMSMEVCHSSSILFYGPRKPLETEYFKFCFWQLQFYKEGPVLWLRGLKEGKELPSMRIKLMQPPPQYLKIRKKNSKIKLMHPPSPPQHLRRGKEFLSMKIKTIRLQFPTQPVKLTRLLTSW